MPVCPWWDAPCCLKFESSIGLWAGSRKRGQFVLRTNINNTNLESKSNGASILYHVCFYPNNVECVILRTRTLGLLYFSIFLLYVISFSASANYWFQSIVSHWNTLIIMFPNLVWVVKVLRGLRYHVVCFYLALYDSMAFVWYKYYCNYLR